MISKPLRLLAFPFAGLFVAWGLAGCDRRAPSADWWQGERERIELSHRVELMHFRYDQLGVGDFEKFEALQQANVATAARLKSLRERQGALAEEVRALEDGWSDFRKNVLREQRQNALGAKYATLTSASGRSYKDVAVAAIDDAGVSIRHASGSARLRFEDLSAEQRALFGLEPDLATAAIARETESAQGYYEWLQNGIEARQAKEERRMEIARQEKVAADRVRAEFQAKLMVAVSQRPLDQPARSYPSRTYYNRYDSYYPHYRTYSNYYYVAPSRCVIPSLSRQMRVNQLGEQFRRAQATFSGK